MVKEGLGIQSQNFLEQSLVNNKVWILFIFGTYFHKVYQIDFKSTKFNWFFSNHEIDIVNEVVYDLF